MKVDVRVLRAIIIIWYKCDRSVSAWKVCIDLMEHSLYSLASRGAALYRISCVLIQLLLSWLEQLILCMCWGYVVGRFDGIRDNFFIISGSTLQANLFDSFFKFQWNTLFSCGSRFVHNTVINWYYIAFTFLLQIYQSYLLLHPYSRLQFKLMLETSSFLVPYRVFVPVISWPIICDNFIYSSSGTL